MFTCSKCSKRNAMYYDEKTKLYFCEDHSLNDLKEAVKMPKKHKKPIKIKEIVKKVFKK